MKIEKYGRIKNSNCGAEQDHVTVGIFCLLSRQGQMQDKKLETQVFLAYLLALLSFAGLSRFHLLEASALGLTVGLTIGGAESIDEGVTMGLSGWFQWNVLMSLRRCSTAKAGS